MCECGDSGVYVVVIERLSTVFKVNAGQRLVGIERRRWVDGWWLRRCSVTCRGCSGSACVDDLGDFCGLKLLDVFFRETLELVRIFLAAETEQTSNGAEREGDDFNEA